MKETVTIRKSDVEKLGKELLKEEDYFLHDEYIINNFPKMKEDQKDFDNIVNILKTQSETGTLNIEEIYDILVNIKLDDEIDGDLYYKKEAYLNIFRVLFVSYSYLDKYILYYFFNIKLFLI